jgi:hypothetical protein
LASIQNIQASNPELCRSATLPAYSSAATIASFQLPSSGLEHHSTYHHDSTKQQDETTLTVHDHDELLMRKCGTTSTTSGVFRLGGMPPLAILNTSRLIGAGLNWSIYNGNALQASSGQHTIDTIS